MLKKAVALLCLIYCSLIGHTALATHIMGGDLTYKNLGNNKVELKFVLYRDCNNGQAAIDNSITYRIYQASYSDNKDYTKFSTRTIALFSKKQVKPEIPKCSVPTGVCAEQGIYIDTITLGTDSVGYHVVWFRNERNNSTITNLEYGSCFSGTKKPYGAIWHTFIPRRAISNSSPQFLTVPVPYLCANKKNVFNPLVNDPDKDSLVFSLEVPYSDPPSCGGSAIPTPFPPGHKDFDKVVYKSGYSVAQPFGSGTSISINSATGEITANAGSSGAYVIAIQIKEYRVDPVTKKTEYVGVIRRDLQFIVGSCPSNTPPQMQQDTGNYVRYIDPGDTVCFTVAGADISDTLYLSASGGIFANNPVIDPPYATFTGTLKANKKVTGEFCWAPTCDQITYTSPYVVTFNLSDEGCNTVSQTFSIYVRSRPILSPPAIHCANLLGKDSIRLTISDSATKVGFDKYIIYRDSAKSGNFVLIDSISSFTTTSWTDKKAYGAANTVYRYYIRARNTCGLEGLPSDTVSNIVVTAQNIADKAARISWNKPYRTASVYYKLYIDEGSGLSLLDSTQSTNYKLNSCYRKFKIQVQADDTSGKCTSHSNITPDVTVQDITAPDTGRIFSASVLKHSQIDLSFSASDSGDTYKYYIYRSENGGAYQLIDSLAHVASQASYTYQDKNVSADKNQYCYKLLMKDTCGNTSAFSAEYCPALLKGAAGQLSSVLSWKASKAEESLDSLVLEEYVSGNWIKKQVLNIADTTVTISGLKCQTTYHYRLRFQHKGSFYYASDVSDSVAVTPFDTVTPAEVNIKGVSVVSGSAIAVTFNKVPDADVKKYEVYASENGGSYTLAGTVTTLTADPQVFMHTGLTTTSKTYSYRVYAVDSCSALKSKTTETHTAVQLSGQAGNLANDLNWSRYKGFTVKEYEVQKLVNGNWTTIQTLAANDTLHTDTALLCNITEYYRIRIIENGGDNAVSLSDTIALTPFDTIKPPQPVVNYVSVVSATQVYVNWEASAHKDVKRYYVYRKVGTGSYTRIDTVDNVTDFTDNNLNTAQNTYCYAIVAVDSCSANESPISAGHCTVLLGSQVNGCTQEIALNWSAYSGWTGVDQYEIYRQASDEASESLLTTLSGSTTSFADNSVSFGKSYTYRIKALQQGGSFASWSNFITDSTFVPEAPEILSVSKTVTSGSNGELVVKWRSQKNSAYMKYHKLYYQSPTGGSFTLLQDKIPVSQDSFIHKSLNTNTDNHSYYLVSEDSCGTITQPSPTHKSTELKMTVGQLTHNLFWTAYEGWPVDKYLIQYWQGGNWVTVDSTTDGSQTSLTRIPMPCNIPVHYRIAASDGVGNLAFSDSAGGQAIDTIPANKVDLRNLTVTDNSTIRLNFTGADSADIFGYGILRSDNGDAYQAVGFINFNGPGKSIVVNDAVDAENDRYCYTIVTLDSCLNATYSDTFCSIRLKGKALNQADSLQWTLFKGYGVQQYTLQEKVNGVWTDIRNFSASDTAFLHDSLACYVTNTYRIVAKENGGGRTSISNTIDLMPIDTISPPAPVLRYASTVPGKGIQLEWEWDTKSDVKYFEIYRKDPLLNYKLIKTVTRDSMYLDPVAPLNTGYYYFIAAVDSCDITRRSAPSDINRLMEISLTTKDCQPVARVYWTHYFGLPYRVDSYRVYRTESGNPPQLIASVSYPEDSFIDLSVMEGMKYTYIVEAYDNESGYSSYSDTMSIVPYVFPVPDKVEIKRATVMQTGTTDGEIRIEWENLQAADIYAKGYHLYTASSPSGPFTLLHDETDLSNTTFLHQNIDTRSGTLWYYLAPYNICGVEGDSSKLHRAVNLTITNKNLEAALSWTHYKGFEVDHYEIERAIGGAALNTRFSVAATDSMFSDNTLVCGTKYTYRIKAVEKGGNSLTALSDTVSVIGFDTIPPVKADVHYATISTTSMATGEVEVKFDGAAEKNRAGYVVYRAIGSSGFVAIDTLKTTASSNIIYTDKKRNTYKNTFSYYFRSFDSCGNFAAPSDTHRTVNLSVQAQNAENVLYWGNYGGFSKWKYVVERRPFGGLNWQDIGEKLPGGANKFEDFDVKCHVKYEYRIRVVDTVSTLISYSNTDTATAFEHIVPLVPDITRVTVTVTGNTQGQAELSWKASTSKDVAKYVIYRRSGSGAWGQIATVGNVTSYLDKAINTHRAVFSYKIRAVDSCGNISKDTSEVHTTINLIATAGNEVIQVDWNKYRGFKVKEYELYRDGSLLITLDSDKVRYVDTGVICVNANTYQLKAIGFDAASWSYSNKDSTRPYDHIPPQPVYLATATIWQPNQQAAVVWTRSASADTKGYRVFRRMGSEGIKMVHEQDGIFDTTFVDDLPFSGQPVCYEVIAYDHCGNSSLLSNQGCLIRLNGTSNKLSNTLNWNPYEHWAAGVDKYNIYRMVDSGQWTLIGTTTADERTYLDEDLQDFAESFCYQVEAIENAGTYNATSKSTVFCLYQDPIVWIPNAFTPQYSINLNDDFGPKGNYFKRFDMVIYNRWGERVYETTESKPWNGQDLKGSQALSGVYLYQITVYGFDGKRHDFNGTFYILD